MGSCNTSWHMGQIRLGSGGVVKRAMGQPMISLTKLGLSADTVFGIFFLFSFLGLGRQGKRAKKTHGLI
eukprot:scaffold22122_cov43-Cyclotella_meneghiniana.AAC.1